MRHCFPLLLLGSACATGPTPPAVAMATPTLARAGAGTVFVQYPGPLPTSYLADRETELCFFLFDAAGAGASMVLVDCCSLYRVPRLRPIVPWLNDWTCAPAPATKPAPCPGP